MDNTLVTDHIQQALEQLRCAYWASDSMSEHELLRKAIRFIKHIQTHRE